MSSRSPRTGSTRTTNSSPPRRQTTSPGRTSERMRAATSRSTVSPAAWPCPSLTALKPSRSTKSRPVMSPDRRARCSAEVTRVRAWARLGSSVSGSCVARCARANCSSSRWRTEVTICWMEACTTSPSGPGSGWSSSASSRSPRATACAWSWMRRSPATASPRAADTVRTSRGPRTSTPTSSPWLIWVAWPASRPSERATVRPSHQAPSADTASSPRPRARVPRRSSAASSRSAAARSSTLSTAVSTSSPSSASRSLLRNRTSVIRPMSVMNTTGSSDGMSRASSSVISSDRSTRSQAARRDSCDSSPICPLVSV